MKTPIDTGALKALFAQTNERPESPFPGPEDSVFDDPDRLATLNSALKEAFKVPPHHNFVMDGAHQ